jgi:hypothetical protein
MQSSQITLLLRIRGALTSAELRESLNVSQATVSRELAKIKGIIRLGAGRSTRYAMAREVPGIGGTIPVYDLDETGAANRIGTLSALENGQWQFAQDYPWNTLRGTEFPDGLYPGLPWFLDDLRPQGFLGRVFARQFGPNLGFPADPREWTADQIVAALVRHGGDMPGNFVLGEEMLGQVQRMALRPAKSINERSRESAYARLAVETLKGGQPGSSAAGEQPKFLTRIRRRSGKTDRVIVKFSGPRDRSEDARWADLLAAEWIVSRVLTEHQIPAAESHLIHGSERTFLESVRFDRAGENGRCAVVSLWAIDGGYFGQPHTPWTAAAERMEHGHWLTSKDAYRLKTLWWYGTLIGNTDMHYGNVSFFLGPDFPCSLAPVYDMLPMLYRPGEQGAIPHRDFSPVPPPPEALEPWREAAGLAEETWARVASERIISKAFRELARANRQTIAQYRKRF